MKHAVFCVFVLCLLGVIACMATNVASSVHTNNWAVIVATSRFWFNYRHPGNALGVYRTVKRMGIPDSQIILMLADDMACNPRNMYPGQVFTSESRSLDLYGSDVEVDYRGYEVTLENFIRVLTGRHDPDTPRSKRLLSDANSNVFIYMSGHGGNEFIKFQDSEELESMDLADAFAQMHEKQRYHELFFMVDTCQAATLLNRIYSPNVLGIGSSLLGENSLSYFFDSDHGLTIIDRFTYYTLSFFEKQSRGNNATIADLVQSYSYSNLKSHVGLKSDLFQRPVDKVTATDFLGSFIRVEVTDIPKDFLGDS